MLALKGNVENRKYKTIFSVAIYLVASTLVFTALSYICQVKSTVVSASEPGLTDLRDFDFKSQVALIAKEDTKSVYIYSGVFYKSKDFENGVNTEGILYDRTEGAQGDFGTLRILLRLPPGKVYALSGKNASYAQRLFIDGVEYKSVGKPGYSSETTIPKTMRFVEGFTPSNNITEIIIHYANFVYGDGGGLYPLDIGYVGNITRNEQLMTFHTAAVTMSLSVAVLFIFGLFLLFPKKLYLLCFGLICGCLELRGLFVGQKIIMLLIPNFDWAWAVKFEAILTIGVIFFSALYIALLFPCKPRWLIIKIGTVVSFISVTFFCFKPPIIFSHYIMWIVLSCAIFPIILLLSVFFDMLRKNLISPLSVAELRLLLSGLLFYATFLLFGTYTHNRFIYLFGWDYTEIGIMVFLFINMLALVLSFSRTEQELQVAIHSQREIKETNKMLERLSRAKSDFLSEISHELKTPLAIMSSYAGLTISQIKKNAIDEYTVDNLDRVQQEAVRLGKLVEQLMKNSLEKERQLILNITSAIKLLKHTADYCDPICRGRKNQINILVLPEGLSLRINTEGIFQVLLNLIVNANRQMQNGLIALSIEMTNDRSHVVFKVTDNGNGIPADLLENILNRGVSGEGSTGLGLAICKEIIEEHGGRMDIISDATGTTVQFILPYLEGENII